MKRTFVGRMINESRSFGRRRGVLGSLSAGRTPGLQIVSFVLSHRRGMTSRAVSSGNSMEAAIRSISTGKSRAAKIGTARYDMIYGPSPIETYNG